MPDISNEVKRLLLENEIAMHRNSAWIVEVRHMVNKKLGGTAEELKPLADEIVKHEASIKLLEEKLETIK